MAVAWGCIVGRVYVSGWLLGSPVGANAAVTTTRGPWPIVMKELTGLPTTVEILDGLGYRRTVASEVLIQGDDGRWMDLDSYNVRFRERTLQHLDGSDAFSKGDLPSTLDALRERRREQEREIESQSLRLSARVDSSALWTQFRRETGWPVRSMETRYVTRTGLRTVQSRYLVGGPLNAPPSGPMSWSQWIDRGIRWPQAMSTPGGIIFTLPLRPIWPGFLMSSITWAAVMWGASRGIGALRRRQRLRIGQCVKCRYQVDELAICPECGAANWGGR